MARRISILTLGTLGSVSPMAALGRVLKDEGYDVSVAAPENFRDMIVGMGLEYRRCGTDFSLFMKDDEAGVYAGAETVKQILAWRFPGAQARAMFEGALRDAVVASADADAIVFHPFVSIACDIAEAKGIPAILVPLSIVSPSADAPLTLLARPNSPLWNRFSYALLRLQRNAFNAAINDIRIRSLGLPKAFRYKHPHMIGRVRVPAIYPVSPVLRPGARDGDDIHFTGYWFRDDEPEWRPSGRLAEFLAAKPRPIYIGFGSMTGLDAKRTAMLLDACVAAGIRAVLGRGWGAFGGAKQAPLPDNFHMLDYAPHRQLFQEVSAVVHHGGLGTTSTGLRAGRPTLICPFMLDQSYWGHRVAELEAGPKPLPITDWTPNRVAAALRDLVENPVYAVRAGEIGEAMRREDGLKTAARLVGQIIGGSLAAAAQPPDEVLASSSLASL